MDHFLHREENRLDSYKLLSACYYLPEEETCVKLAELEEAMAGEYAKAAEHVSGMRGETEIEQLKIDYSRLFVGPFNLLVPPYGSVYLEGGRRVMGDSTLDAQKRYREVGLDISGDIDYLIFKEIEALGNSDFENAIDYLKKQQGFLEDHLGVWAPKLADEMEKNANTEFYRNLGRSTKVFVEKDLHDVLATSIAELFSLAGQA
jgi:TorA maturation chaperone TorD